MVQISILMPLFNSQRYLDEALRSIDSQTCREFDIIAVDDGSTDRTPDILQHWSTRLPIRLIRLAEHQGIVSALNQGLGIARGRYIARMDGDDLMAPRRLERQISFLDRHPDIDLLGSRVRCFRENGAVTRGVRQYEKWVNLTRTEESMKRDLYLDCPLPHPTWMGRTSLFQSLGGYQGSGAEDYDFLFRTIYTGHRIHKLPLVLLHWRDHGERQTRTNPELKRTRIFGQKAAHFRSHETDGKEPLMIFGIGRYGKAIADSLLREELPVTGFVDPTNKYVHSTVRGLPVVPMNAPVPHNVHLISACPKYGLPPNPDISRYLQDHRTTHWVL